MITGIIEVVNTGNFFEKMLPAHGAGSLVVICDLEQQLARESKWMG